MPRPSPLTAARLGLALLVVAAGCTGEMSASYGPTDPAAEPPGANAPPPRPMDPDLPDEPSPDDPDPDTPPDPDPDPDAPDDPLPDEQDPPVDDLPAFAPAPPALHRLTAAQYRNAIDDLIGPGVDLPPLEADTPLHGFASVGSAELTISALAAEQYDAAARAVTDHLVAAPDRLGALMDCDPAAEACRRDFLERFGRRAWRRPLAVHEVDALLTLADDIGARFNDPRQGVAWAINALLQSPDFLFRVEIGEPDPLEPGARRYTDYEMASRLSFLIWNTIPDEALLDGAADGALTDAAVLPFVIDDMLDDPRARRGVGGFFAEYLGLGALDHLEKDRAAFPQMSETLGRAMRAEIEAAVERIVFEQDGDLRALLTTRTTTVNGELAALYTLPPVDGPTLIELPEDNPRGGLFGMAGFLALTAHHTVSSPTHRGKYVQNKVMCFDIPPPPPGVATSLDGIGEADGPMTTRQKLAAHRADPTCAACHRHMDPIGLGLENFDAIGAWRTTENGLPIDARSEIDGEPFEGPRRLGEVLAAQPDFGACVARQLFRHGTGHLESRAEERAVRDLGRAFAEDGHRVRALVHHLVLSDAFRRVGPPDDTVPGELEPGEMEGTP